LADDDEFGGAPGSEIIRVRRVVCGGRGGGATGGWPVHDIAITIVWYQGVVV